MIPKQLTAWLKHVAAHRRAHPSQDYKTALQMASKTYKSAAKSPKPSKPMAKPKKATRKAATRAPRSASYSYY